MKPFRHSLSGRLVALFVITAIAFVLLVGLSIGSAFRSHFQDTVRPHLLRYLQYIQADIGVPPNFARAEQLAAELDVEIHIHGANGAWSSNHTDLDMTHMNVHRRFTSNDVNFEFGSWNDRDYLVAHLPQYTLALGTTETRERGPWHWRLIPLLVLLVILVLLYHGTRRLFAPIELLKTGLARIGAGDLAYRIDIKRQDEFGKLASSVNRMADDIQRMLDAKRQLLLAISHELRSPLTRAKVAVELLDDAQQRTGLSRDLNEMEKLIEELLETERLTARHDVLNKKRVSLNELAHAVVREAFAGRAIQISVPEHDISAEVDEVRVRLLLKNLLDNALRHTSAGSPAPELRLEYSDHTAVLTIKDHGTGIEQRHLPHLSEPFYRADTARLRETGGYGLGLYLCRVIAEAHGGTLRIDSELGRGTSVRVSLPMENTPNIAPT